MDIEYFENGKMRVVLFGFLATILSPFLAVVYITHCCLRMMLTVAPLVTLVLVVIIGLPLLTIAKTFYNVWTIVQSTFIFFLRLIAVANNSPSSEVVVQDGNKVW